MSALTWMDRTGKDLGRIGDPAVMASPAISPDGSRIAVDISDQKASNVDIWIESVNGASNARFTFDPSEEVTDVWSRDGSTLAYASDESGNWEIYVTSFAGAAGKWQVSRGGGTEPRWRGDGKEIFYIGRTGRLMAVSASGENGFSTGTTTPPFQIHGRAAISSTDVFTYDVTKDGKRFLVNRYLKPAHITPLTIVLNATAEQQH